MNTLIVYFSRTGTTRRLARRIADALEPPNVELEELSDGIDRRGVLGYLRSGAEAWLKRGVTLAPLGSDASTFDLVLIGTPVWRMSMSSPVRTYLEDHAAELRRVAFFCTMGGLGGARVFRQMEELCGQAPIATFAQTHRQRVRADDTKALEAFIDRLRAAVPEDVALPQRQTPAVQVAPASPTPHLFPQ